MCDANDAMFSYGGYGDLASRRKNATRESTATLKAWLNEHKKNPYPTKGEKIMLAIITKMTLTQVTRLFMNTFINISIFRDLFKSKSGSEATINSSDSRESQYWPTHALAH